MQIKTKEGIAEPETGIKIDRRMKLHDYTRTRIVINSPQFYNKSQVANLLSDVLVIPLTHKVRRELRISQYNKRDFKVIICRKRV